MPRKRVDLAPAASGLGLEPTFSPAEAGAHLGLGHNAVAELIAFGRSYGSALHPERGGLWPTFLSGRHRRIPLSALDRHKRHLARLNGETPPPPTSLVLVREVQVEAAA
jgi:hypothetical protein